MSVTVITDLLRFVAWHVGSRTAAAGSSEAALALYGERGFENTTVAEIAERAGLTERTFFRHFADKREVLFGGAAMLEELLVSSVAGAPDSAAPIDAVVAALEAAGALLQERRAFARQRQMVIAANAELRDGELIKLASLASALADSLRRRGVSDPAASLDCRGGDRRFQGRLRSLARGGQSEETCRDSSESRSTS